jgi:hypothetical protein
MKSGECHLEWREWTNVFPDEYKDKGVKDCEWADVGKLFGIADWDNRSKKCDCNPRTIIITDNVRLSFGNPPRKVARKVCFEIGAGSSCHPNSEQRFANQFLEYEPGKGITIWEFSPGRCGAPHHPDPKKFPCGGPAQTR